MQHPSLATGDILLCTLAAAKLIKWRHRHTNTPACKQDGHSEVSNNKKKTPHTGVGQYFIGDVITVTGLHTQLSQLTFKAHTHTYTYYKMYIQLSTYARAEHKTADVSQHFDV